MAFVPGVPLITDFRVRFRQGELVMVTWEEQKPEYWSYHTPREVRRLITFADEATAAAAVKIFQALGNRVVRENLWAVVEMEATL